MAIPNPAKPFILRILIGVTQLKTSAQPCHSERQISQLRKSYPDSDNWKDGRVPCWFNLNASALADDTVAFRFGWFAPCRGGFETRPYDTARRFSRT